MDQEKKKIREDFAARRQVLRESRNKARADFAARQQVLRESRLEGKKAAGKYYKRPISDKSVLDCSLERGN